MYYFLYSLKTKIGCLSKNSSLNIFITETECVYSPVGTEPIFYGSTALVVPGLIVEVSQTLLDNTQHSKEGDIYAPGEIRNRNPNNRAAEDSLQILEYKEG
jgi:hypothetical protein